jgi:hypothetical protein
MWCTLKIIFVKTIFGQKDTSKVQCDMQIRGIWPHLRLTQHLNNHQKILKLATSCVFTSNELNIFLSRLSSLKFQQIMGHAINKKLVYVKTHDFHLLMQQLLPLCMHGLIVVEFYMAIMKLNCVFWWDCAKVWNPIGIENLWENVVVTLSLEKKFLLSFFDILTQKMLSYHLLHVVDEQNICGPIHSHWMYLIERKMKMIKRCVCNVTC